MCAIKIKENFSPLFEQQRVEFKKKTEFYINDE